MVKRGGSIARQSYQMFCYEVEFSRDNKKGTIWRIREILTEGKASGGLIISDMRPARSSGIYMISFKPSELGIPGLYLDWKAGTLAREAAKKGRSATLKLVAKREKAEV
jgi:hypothetical protein